MTLDKATLRRKILQQRQSLSLQEWRDKSLQICARLKTNSLFRSAEVILAYFSFRQEVDLAPLFALDKSWAFPRCVDTSLIWHSWQPKDRLQQGKYGIQEPLNTAPKIESAKADLILVPMVAGDRRGYRLGYGGGYYDRLLSSAASKVTTIGIVYDFAYTDKLPKDPWDVRLDYICTESTCDRFTIYRK